MKILRNILIIISCLPVLLLAATWQYCPDEIPAHFDLYGQLTRMGSKRELLILPFLLLIFLLILLLIARRIKRNASRRTMTNLWIYGLIFQGIFVLLFISQLYFALNGNHRLLQNSTQVGRISTFICGLFLFVTGMLFLHDYYGRKINDKTKRKSRFFPVGRFTTFSTITAGLLLLLASLLSHTLSSFHLVLFMVILLMMQSIHHIIRYKLYHDD
ncbi:MAG: DUF1648 domain-containing protein [Eubacteriales bacterium]|nr:DUF1648 domain-containing protein [Eubacteriales bacterium]